MKILLLGPHGAGKSTQAHLLAAALHLPYISTGEMLRALQSHDTPLAEEIRELLKEGQYLSDEQMISLVKQRLLQPDLHRGFILEGFPRTLAQAEALDEPIDIVFHLTLNDTVSMERLLARQRSDDTPEIIKRRLDKHHQEAEPVLQFYRKHKVLCEINAGQPVELVFSDIMTAVRDFYDRNQD